MDEEMTGKSLRQVEHTHGHYILGKFISNYHTITSRKANVYYNVMTVCFSLDQVVINTGCLCIYTIR